MPTWRMPCRWSIARIFTGREWPPTANGHANGHTNGHANGHANGVANGGGKHGGHLLDEGKEPKVLEIGEEEDFGTSGLQPAEPPGVTPVPGRE